MENKYKKYIESKLRIKKKSVKRIEEQYMECKIQEDKSALNIEQIAVLGLEIRLLEKILKDCKK